MVRLRVMRFWMKLTGGTHLIISHYHVYISLGRIALVPHFPGLRHFKQGRNFKQWTGDDSRALMKVNCLIISFIFTFIYGCRFSSLLLRDMCPQTWLGLSMHTLISVTWSDATSWMERAWIKLTIPFVVSINIGKFFKRQVSEPWHQKASHYHDNMPWFITDHTSKTLEPQTVSVLRLLNQNTL